MTVAVGDKIKLIKMPDDPNPIASGMVGTITGIQEAYSEGDVPLTYVVLWENGKTRNVLVGVDRFELLK
jgi:hypothetical protein